MTNSIDCVLLFSGGLDSLLAYHLLKSQGLNILCAHFTSPFFGTPAKLEEWRQLYGIEAIVEDVGEDFVSMLAHSPEHGFGKNLNPCMDCKILQLKAAKNLMLQKGARFLATGEVIGQRPMSQRRDCLQRILKRAAVDGILLRPLCARLLEPVEVETTGFVDRSRLLAISGRGRNEQLELAKTFSLKKIPAPGGGCNLTQGENARRYWQVLKYRFNEDMAKLTRDFYFANTGRQLWRIRENGAYWLAVGRTAEDNGRLLELPGDSDVTLKVIGMPGPIARARDGELWPEDVLAEAAQATAGYCPKARGNTPVAVSARGRDWQREFVVLPDKLAENWRLPDRDEVKKEIGEKRREMARQ